MAARRVFAVALLLALLQACASFGVGAGRRAVAQPVQPRLARWAVDMKSKEDKEFEEWVRQKKIASGVDPDEDFGAGRRVEGSIYLVGGLVTVLVPTIAGIWAYNEGYLTPQ